MKQEVHCNLMQSAYLKAAEAICEEVVEFHKRIPKDSNWKTKRLSWVFRLDLEMYRSRNAVNGDNTARNQEVCLYFRVNYYVTSGRYTKVTWQICDICSKPVEGEKEIADHDSCWRGCWEDISKWVWNNMEPLKNLAGDPNFYFTCENFKMEEV